MSKSRRKNHHWNQKEQESFFLRDIEKKKRIEWSLGRKEFDVEDDSEYKLK